jgi:methionyl-tRNA formyltransferase
MDSSGAPFDSRETITVCATGLKGEIFVSGLLSRGIRPALIISYDQKDDLSKSFSRLAEIAAQEKIKFLQQKYLASPIHGIVFMVGWQYLLKDLAPFSVVFHDSLLPRYRGFAPTVTALINGEPEIGVTALSPSENADEGLILGQLSLPIKYPVRIAEALKLQASLMVDLAVSINAQWLQGSLASHAQNNSEATYSLWRDDADYEIDWSRSAEEIRRFIDAVGYPYKGARTSVNGEDVIIESASVVDDLRFEGRHLGKVWRIEKGCPIVVCGHGLLRLEAARKLAGEIYEFRKLRVRMGAPR